MVHALILFLKFAILLIFAVIIAQQPGDVTVNWRFDNNSYTFKVTLGAALITIILGTILLLFLYRKLIEILRIPENLRRFKRRKRMESGHRALNNTFLALASGNPQKAYIQAEKAYKKLEHEKNTQFTRFLTGQTARLAGQNERARLHFEQLLQDQSNSFLGLKGLLHLAMDNEDIDKAIALAREAKAHTPKAYSLDQTLYTLLLIKQDWDEAYDLLKSLRNKAYIPLKQADSDMASLLYLLAEKEVNASNNKAAIKLLRHGLSITPGHTGLTILLAQLYQKESKTRALKSLIKQSWRTRPHPDLLIFWDNLAPSNTAKRPLRRIDWYQRLVDLTPKSMESHLAVAQAAIDDGVWSLAREALTEALKLGETARIYRLYAELERLSTQDESRVRDWLSKASMAPQSKTWICSATGKRYDQWHPVATPHNAFNTMDWQNPIGIITSRAAIAEQDTDLDRLIGMSA